MSLRHRLFCVLASLLFASAGIASDAATPDAHAATTSTLNAHQAWIRQPPPGSRVAAGYAVLSNTGDAPLVIVGGESPAFRAVELHEMIMDGDTMRMRPLPRLEIPAGGTVRLAPGGVHVMLHHPQRVLTEGDRIRVTLALEGGDSVDLWFDVRREAIDVHAH